MPSYTLFRVLGLAMLLLALSAAAAADESVRSTIRERLEAVDPNTGIDAIEPTPVDGLYAVTMGSQVVYVTADGRYLLRGELIDLADGRNLTERRRQEVARSALAELGEDELLVYEPEGETRFEVTVFTDIECPYCQRLHRQLDAYLERGIRVRYAFLPRAGVGSRAYDKAVAAWCADQPHRALTRAKRGESLPRRDCDNPVQDHLRLAQRLGIRGTPAILASDGRMFRGYVPPEKLVRRLEAGEG